MFQDEKKVVVIGGGTGLSVLLKGLKKYTSRLTAVVTVSDDGGSSGRLRTELGILPPGDIRNCLVALAETEVMMEKIFQYRFENGNSLQGHSLGNLLLAAMTEITGDFVSAIREISKVLAVRGEVIPVTLENVHLGAIMNDNEIIYGETAIRDSKKGIKDLFLVPQKCQPVPETIKAIENADAIVIGPGSLYTSIIPNLLVNGVSEAIAGSSACKIYISNIMTEKGETDNYTTTDHVKAINTYAGRPVIDYVLANSGIIDEFRKNRYREENAVPVRTNQDEIKAMGMQLICTDLLSDYKQAWHDSAKLAQAIFKIIGG